MDTKITKTPNGYVLELHGHVISLSVEEFNRLYAVLFTEHYDQEAKKYAKS